MCKSGKSCRTLKNCTDIIQSVATILAFVAGGWWFVAQGLTKPRLKLEHTVTARPLSPSSTDLLITVNVVATNIGSTGVHLEQGNLQIGQVIPTPGHDLKKLSLKELWLEPGESDQALFGTYIIPRTIKTVFLESSYTVPHKNLVWDFKSVADIKDNDSTTSTRVSSGIKEPSH